MHHVIDEARTDLLSSSLTTKEVLLESRSCLFKFIQAVLLTLNKAGCVFCFAQRAEPVAIWNFLQRRRQAKQVAPSVAPVAQNDFFFMVASLAELTVQCIDVVWHPDAVRGLTSRVRVLPNRTKAFLHVDCAFLMPVSKLIELMRGERIPCPPTWLFSLAVRAPAAASSKVP